MQWKSNVTMRVKLLPSRYVAWELDDVVVFHMFFTFSPLLIWVLSAQFNIPIPFGNIGLKKSDDGNVSAIYLTYAYNIPFFARKRQMKRDAEGKTSWFCEYIDCPKVWFRAQSFSANFREGVSPDVSQNLSYLWPGFLCGRWSIMIGINLFIRSAHTHSTSTGSLAAMWRSICFMRRLTVASRCRRQCLTFLKEVWYQFISHYRLLCKQLCYIALKLTFYPILSS